MKICRIFFLVFILTFLFTSGIFAQLNNKTNQADYIIITVSQFDSTLQNFVKWRSKDNLKLKVVNANEIYAEFPDTTKQNSIRDFISYALEYWQNPKPQYILLAGDAKLIPAIYVPSLFANNPEWDEDSVAIDELYSINLYQQDTEPDVALGRFPVNNIIDLNNIIDKTIYFEDSLSAEFYKNDFIILTDLQDSLSFNISANDFINAVLNGKYSVKKIYGDKIF